MEQKKLLEHSVTPNSIELFREILPANLKQAAPEFVTTGQKVKQLPKISLTLQQLSFLSRAFRQLRKCGFSAQLISLLLLVGLPRFSVIA